MNWEQKLNAMIALCGWSAVSLKMREPGNWYVEVIGRNIGGGGFLRGEYGEGRTPQEAVEDDWRRLVDELPEDRVIVVSRRSTEETERRVRWNGYMWADVPREKGPVLP